MGAIFDVDVVMWNKGIWKGMLFHMNHEKKVCFGF